jgi:uncharacterized coiled-coil protein SlyX
MDSEHAERLTKIESHLAHLEHQLEQMNQVIIAQGRELARLKTWQQRVGQSLENTEGQRIRDTNPKPPHYQ